MRITNTRIEKQREEINRTKAKIAEFQAKLREQEKHLRNLEDLEIVAQFRSERMSDKHLDTLRPKKFPLPPDDTEVLDKTIKEDTRNANTEN
jgi:hypothetical protein